MVTQVIFFAAIALLILLLGRRFRLYGWRLGPAVSRGAGAANRLGTSMQRFLAWRPKIRLPLPSAKKPASAPFMPTGIEKQPTAHQFWQEENLATKPELLSNFEEGNNLFKAGKYDEAERFFLKAATSNPKDPRVYGKLGLIYLNTRSYNDAIESLKVAVKLDKYNPSRHYNLALAYWGNNDGQRAIASIREAISLDPVTPKYRQFLDEMLNKK